MRISALASPLPPATTMVALQHLLRVFRSINDVVAKVTMAIGIGIVGFLVAALTASALTRFTLGTGYHAFIELPPVLVPWLVFPLLGPLLRDKEHISVDILPVFLSARQSRYLRLFLNCVVLGAAYVFMVAGVEAVQLFQGLGQMLELEFEFPIWYMYLAFPVGFAILISFAVELLLAEIVSWNSVDTPENAG